MITSPVFILHQTDCLHFVCQTDTLLSYPAQYAPPATASVAPEGDRFIEKSFEKLSFATKRKF